MFAFLAHHTYYLKADKELVTTNGTDVLRIPPQDTSRLSPCDHVEADTRMSLHLADEVNVGFRTILLCTVDSDVLILAVKASAKFDVQELWVAFGTGKKFRYIPAHEIAFSLGPDKSQAPPVFQAYTAIV